MRQHFVPVACASVVCALVSVVGAAQQREPAGVMPETGGSVLRIDGPITRWDEGLPIGNGLVGALVWGEGRTIRISLDRADLWDTRLPEVFASPEWTYANMIALKEAKNHARHQELFDLPYDTIPYPTKLPVGRVEITLPEGVTVAGFWLTLDDGVATVRVIDSRDESETTLDVLPARVGYSLLVDALPAGSTYALRSPEGTKLLGYPDAVHGSQEYRRWFTQSTLGELQYTVLASPLLMGLNTKPSDVDYPLAIAIAAHEDVQTGFSAGMSEIPQSQMSQPNMRAMLARHRAREFPKPRVAIPDARLQLHYDLCTHLYIAGSLGDQPPMPLQGVWTADEGGLPPWKGDYHNDLNTQMTYLAYHAAGLIYQGWSWINFNSDLLTEYRSFARSFYALPARDDRYADARHEPALIPGVMTIEGKAMGGWGQHSLSPTHSAWIAQSFYLDWKYSGDDSRMLNLAYPFCAAIGNGLLGLMTKDEKGHLKLPLSSSPEIHDNSYEAWLVPNSNYDLSLMRWLFAALKEMAEVAGEPAVAAKWGDALGAMEPLHIDEKTGLMFDARETYSQSHRHFSHAMAIHPLGTLSIEGSDADRAAIHATLDQLKAMGTDWWTGYSFSWAACMFARAGRAEEALDYLTKYLAFTGPNGFHLNGDQTKSGLSKFTYRPFTLEGNFLAMEAIHQMLLQSHGTVGVPNSEVVRIFPAVSETWADVSFDGLRAEGGWIVSARREAGRTLRVEIVAPSGSSDRATRPDEIGPNARARTLRLRDPFQGREAHWSREVRREGTDIVVELRPGEFLVGEAR